MPVAVAIWLCAIAIVLIMLIYVVRARYKHGYFVRANIPGPTPNLLLGNLGSLWQTSHGWRQLETWTRQYGRIYGIFEGTLPIYVASDVDFLEEVYIKQFSNFSNRKPLLALLPSQDKLVHLFDAEGETWHRQRRVINPTFSTAKLNQMIPLFNDCMDQFMNVLAPLADENAQDINVRPVYLRLYMDTLCRCAFSFDTDVQQNPDNPYLQKLNEFFALDSRKMFFVKIASAVPALGNFVVQITVRINKLLVKLSQTFSFINYSELAIIWLMDHIGKQVVFTRKDKKKSERVDLLHLMLDAATDQNIQDDEGTHDKTMTESSESPSVIRNKLTYDEIIANVFLFFIAGAETTSTALSYCSYVLATHNDIQQKLQDEIDANIGDNFQSLTYDMIDKLEYLDMFIKEVMRMYPIGPIALTRVCARDTTIGKHRIEKGTAVQIDLYSVHYDPALWGPVDPYQFYPERHATKRHPLALLQFGAGPRRCAGMRFGLLGLKMACIRLLKSFNVLPGDKLNDALHIIELTTIVPEAIWIRLERRTEAS